MPTETLITSVKAFQEQISSRMGELETISEKAGKQDVEADALYAQMGFREKYLRGYLWGDRDLYKRYKEEQSLVRNFNAQVRQLEENISELKGGMHEQIHTELVNEQNSTYLNLQESLERSQKFKKKINRFLDKISDASQEVTEGQIWENTDKITKTTQSSVRSTRENREAYDAVEDLKQDIADFQEDVTEYNKIEQNPKIIELCQKLAYYNDTEIDLAADVYDFRGSAMGQELRNAQEALDNLSSRAEGIRKIVNGEIKKIETAMFNQRESIKEQCLAL